MKKIIVAVLCLCVFLCGCTVQTEYTNSDKLQIVCTSFPAYDFARSVAGDKADISLLIKPGTEVHSFEPTPKDIIRIQESDLFICNGGESEEWVQELVNDDMNIVYMMDCVETVAEEVKEGMQTHENGEEEEEELDEHVWTSPMNAISIVQAVARQLILKDPDNTDCYNINSAKYIMALAELDIELRAAVNNAAHKTLIFADRFPMRYFAKEYGLDYFAAFPGCSGETEPSAKTVAYLIDRVREKDIPAVLYMEFSNQKMADVICEDAGCKKLPFYSAHNITAKQLEDGVTYLDLMQINLQSLKEALG